MHNLLQGHACAHKNPKQELGWPKGAWEGQPGVLTCGLTQGGLSRVSSALSDRSKEVPTVSGKASMSPPRRACTWNHVLRGLTFVECAKHGDFYGELSSTAPAQRLATIYQGH